MPDFSDLVLLIGTNPLPNYVVAEYFLKTNQELRRIWLVHSEEVARQVGTKTQAENLEKVLKERHSHSSKLSFPLSKVTLSNVSSAEEIFHDIKKKLIRELPSSSSVHLNYTGGTKAMGTHVYRAIEQDGTKSLAKSFSYMDGRNFQIVDDSNRKVNTMDLRKEISISFSELIALHGFKRKNHGADNKDFSAAIQVYKGMIEEGRLDDYDSENGGYNRTLFENKNEPGELANTICGLRQELNNSIAREPFLSVIRAMPEDYQVFDAHGHFITPSSGKKLKHAIKFLDGGWLEGYVHATLQREMSKNHIVVLKDWEIDKDGWTNEFQIDVILLKGYQLIGISCTTSQEKPLCKNKGFEIILRTRQIGGDEAKSILVALVDDSTKKTLKEELQLNAGITSGNILVLGKNDLKERYLVQSIADFIHQEV